MNDSKTLSEKLRLRLKELVEREAIAYSVTHIHEEEIDTLNILNASIEAMQRSIYRLNPAPNFISVDGNRFKPIDSIPYQTIIKGDGKYLNIAAASILAKTYRDQYMAEIHEEFPMYNWIKNKGYPTKEHREAISKYGPSKYHRQSFKLLPNQYKLDL